VLYCPKALALTHSHTSDALKDKEPSIFWEAGMSANT